jgi:acetyl esterase/lipase
MSLRARLLNTWLRRIERPALARMPADRPEKLRNRFAMNMRLIYGRPRKARQISVAGIPALEVGPQNDSAPILYLHGGGYVFGDPASYHGMCTRIGRAAGRRVIIPDYPLAPEQPFPAAPEAAIAIYRELSAKGPVILAGDSAGGGLALVLLSLICAKGLPQPVVTIALSPLTDLSFSGVSFSGNARVEAVLPPERLAKAGEVYLAGADPADPRATPLNADFPGASAVHMWVGDTEILLDDARRMADHLRRQGVDVHLTEAHNLPHVWPIFADWQLPESTATVAEIANVIQTSLDSASL